MKKFKPGDIAYVFDSEFRCPDYKVEIIDVNSKGILVKILRFNRKWLFFESELLTEKEYQIKKIIE